MRIEILPASAALRYAVFNTQGAIQAAFISERDARYWIDMTSASFDPTRTKDAASELDLAEGSRRS